MVTFFNKKIISALCGVLALVSCSEEKPKEPVSIPLTSADNIILRPAKFSDLKNWKKDDTGDLIPAFARSCEKILKLKSEFLYDSAIKISAAKYQRICLDFFAENIQTSKQFRVFLKENFEPWQVWRNDSGKGRFTSYYQAEIRASETKDEVYKYPVFGTPEDLISVDLQKFSSDLPVRTIVGRVKNGRLEPYYTRAEIENNSEITKNYPVLLWGDNPIDIYFMQIQGSALAKLPNGRLVSVDYAANNGKKFKGIGSILLEHKMIESGKASMANIKNWLEENYDEAKKYMDENERYVFYQISGREGMLGSQDGVVLTPQRSLAVDREIIPYGSLLWLETTGPDNEPIEKFVIAQDTGAAIKGAIRGDYFWGYGDEALRAAGKMSSTGRYYILLPKNND